MKLTKEIIDVLKYHGMMTMTAPARVFIDRYKTVEELADAGFVNDRGAFDLLNNIFDEEGKNQCAPTEDADVVEETITEEIPEDDETGKKVEEPVEVKIQVNGSMEKVEQEIKVAHDGETLPQVVEEIPEDDETGKKEEVIDDAPIAEEVVEEQEEPVIETVNEETENGILIGASEETKEDAVEETPVEETPKPKKTTTKKTTTKKTSTKKES